MKRHHLDPWSLVGGIFLTGMGPLFLLPREPLDLADRFGDLLGWAVPVLVVVVGIALIAPAIRRRQEEEDFDISSEPDPFERI